tara:strand:+ start:16065 stop:17327 length:1263 start_codon:yes stop_codon:yes gene_type:complete
MNFPMPYHEAKQKIINISRSLATLLGAVVRDFIQGTLPLRATSLVYTTILSFVPLLALSFSVLKSFGAHNQLAPFLNSLLEPLGSKGVEVASNILLFVDNIKVGVLGALGLGFLLFTVVSLIQKIEAAYNNIWHIEKPRPHVQRFTGYLSVITVGPIVIFSLLGLKTKFTTNPLIADKLGFAVNSGIMPYVIDTVSAVALPILLFTFMNKSIPNTKVNWGPAIISGIATAYMWKAVASGFGSFMSNSGNYDAIYSSFAVILLVFIWLYLNWLVILIGGSICFYIQNPEQATFSLHKEEYNYQDKLYNTLLLLKKVHERFREGQPPIKLTEVGKLYGNYVFAQEVTQKLVAAQIITCDESNNGEIVLIKSLEKVSLHDLMSCFSGNHKHTKTKSHDKALMGFIKNMETDWKSKTLKQIIES